MTYDITRDNTRPGQPPTSCWVALPLDAGHSVIALVGVYDLVMAFRERLRQYGLRRLQFASVATDGFPKLGVFYAGIWPASECRAVVTALHGDPDADHRAWARNFRRIRHDPSRTAEIPDREQIAGRLARLYLEEVIHAADAVQ